MQIHEILAQFNINAKNPGGYIGSESLGSDANTIVSVSPVDGATIASVTPVTPAEYDRIIRKSQEAFTSWRLVPAPKRGEIVRQLGDQLRVHKEALGILVSYEMGKVLTRGTWRSSRND